MSSSARQLERMLALVPYLQVNAGIPISELAESFGVPANKIRKELIALAMTGTRPQHDEMIDFDRTLLDEGLAFIKNAGFMTRPLKLSGLEGASLIAALGVLRHMAEGEQVEIIDRVTAKIHSALSMQDSPGISVHVHSAAEDVRSALTSALQSGTQVRIRYASDRSDSETERTIDPLTLTVDRGHMYLTAWCHYAEGERVFRLDRILELTPLDTPIQVQPAESTTELFDFGANTSAAVLEVDPIARWIVEPCQPELIREEPDGVHVVKVHAVDDSWLARLVLLGGGSIRVLEPTSLAEIVRATAASALDAYDRT